MTLLINVTLVAALCYYMYLVAMYDFTWYYFIIFSYSQRCILRSTSSSYLCRLNHPSLLQHLWFKHANLCDYYWIGAMRLDTASSHNCTRFLPTIASIDLTTRVSFAMEWVLRCSPTDFELWELVHIYIIQHIISLQYRQLISIAIHIHI